MSTLGDFLSSINYNKEDLLVGQYSPEDYPVFHVARTLSYFPDTVLLVNEINKYGTVEFEVSPDMHYQFLLNLVPRRKRFSRWARPEKEEYLQFVARKYLCSMEKAIEYLPLFTDEELEQLKQEFDEGGL